MWLYKSSLFSQVSNGTFKGSYACFVIEQAGFVEPHSSSTIGWVGFGVGWGWVVVVVGLWLGLWLGLCWSWVVVWFGLGLGKHLGPDKR